MKKIAVILSGCGVFDGAEIHEAVLTLLALEKAGAQAICAAPNVDQREVVDHITGKPQPDEFRNVYEESARIARGQIFKLSELKLSEIDALVFIGGFGVAKNLSSFASDGAEFDIDPMIRNLIEDAHEQGKPQGFMCIAPVLAAAVLGSKKVQLTVGNNPEVAAKLESRGASLCPCAVDAVVVDSTNRIISTPAYMDAKNLLQVEAGINNLVKALIKLSA
jgi:enhancing lycopene biosynthesis protein 2